MLFVHGAILPTITGLDGTIGTVTYVLHPLPHCTDNCPCGFPLPQTMVTWFPLWLISVPPIGGNHVGVTHPTALYVDVSPAQTVLMHSIDTVPGSIETIFFIVSEQQVTFDKDESPFMPGTSMVL